MWTFTVMALSLALFVLIGHFSFVSADDVVPGVQYSVFSDQQCSQPFMQPTINVDQVIPTNRKCVNTSGAAASARFTVVSSACSLLEYKNTTQLSVYLYSTPLNAFINISSCPLLGQTSGTVLVANDPTLQHNITSCVSGTLFHMENASVIATVYTTFNCNLNYSSPSNSASTTRASSWLKLMTALLIVSHTPRLGVIILAITFLVLAIGDIPPALGGTCFLTNTNIYGDNNKVTKFDDKSALGSACLLPFNATIWYNSDKSLVTCINTAYSDILQSQFVYALNSIPKESKTDMVFTHNVSSIYFEFTNVSSANGVGINFMSFTDSFGSSQTVGTAGIGKYRQELDGQGYPLTFWRGWNSSIIDSFGATYYTT